MGTVSPFPDISIKLDLHLDLNNLISHIWTSHIILSRVHTDLTAKISITFPKLFHSPSIRISKTISLFMLQKINNGYIFGLCWQKCWGHFCCKKCSYLLQNCHLFKFRFIYKRIKAETVDLFKVGPGPQLTKILKIFHSPLSKKENFQNFSRSWNFFLFPWLSKTFHYWLIITSTYLLWVLNSMDVKQRVSAFYKEQEFYQF